MRAALALLGWSFVASAAAGWVEGRVGPAAGLWTGVALLGAGILVWLRAMEVRMDAAAFRPGAGDVLPGVGAGLLLFVLGGLGYAATGFLLGEAAEAVPVPGSPGGALLLLPGVLLAAVLEEIVFRRALLKPLRTGAGAAAAVTATAVAFALYHLSVLQLLPGLLYGAVLGALVVRDEGRLGRAIVAHGTLNLLGWGALVAGATGPG